MVLIAGFCFGVFVIAVNGGVQTFPSAVDLTDHVGDDAS